MRQQLHSNAKTTKSIRREIQESKLSRKELAIKYNLSPSTVRRWVMRTTQEDKSSRPNKTRLSLSIEQIDIILYERKHNKRTISEIAEIIGV